MDVIWEKQQLYLNGNLCSCCVQRLDKFSEIWTAYWLFFDCDGVVHHEFVIPPCYQNLISAVVHIFYGVCCAYSHCHVIQWFMVKNKMAWSCSLFTLWTLLHVTVSKHEIEAQREDI